MVLSHRSLLLVGSLVLEYVWLLAVGIFPQRYNALASFEVIGVIIVQEVLLGLLCFFTALVVLTIDGTFSDSRLDLCRF